MPGQTAVFTHQSKDRRLGASQPSYKALDEASPACHSSALDVLDLVLLRDDFPFGLVVRQAAACTRPSTDCLGSLRSVKQRRTEGPFAIGLFNSLTPTKIWLSGPSVVLLPCVSAVPVPVCWGFRSARAGTLLRVWRGISLDGNVCILALQLRPVGGKRRQIMGCGGRGFTGHAAERRVRVRGQNCRTAGYGGEVG